MTKIKEHEKMPVSLKMIISFFSGGIFAVGIATILLSLGIIP